MFNPDIHFILHYFMSKIKGSYMNQCAVSVLCAVPAKPSRTHGVRSQVKRFTVISAIHTQSTVCRGAVCGIDNPGI